MGAVTVRRTPLAVADSFERASLGADWSRPQGDAVVVASRALGAGSAAGIHVATWAANPFPDDQFAEATLAADISTVEHQVVVRRRSADLARYGFCYNEDGAGSPRWIIKYDGVAAQDTRTWATAYTTPLKPGDTIRLEARGQSPVGLRGFHNNVLVIEASDADAARVLSGPPGVAYRARGGTTPTYPTPVYESWRGGAL